MAILSNRRAFEVALKGVQKEQRALFEAMQGDLAALLARYTDRDGKIPPSQSQALRDEARTIVQRFFVATRRASPDERRAEGVRLRALIQTAQRQMKGATERQKNELRQRIVWLGNRLQLLEREGLLYESINPQGQAVSPFARSLLNQMRTVVTAVVQSHVERIRKVMNGARKSA